MIRRIAIIVATIVGIILVLTLTASYFAGLVLGLKTSYREIEIALTNEEKIIVLGIDDDAIYPHKMDLKMTGKINGQGILRFGWRDSIFYRSDTISCDFLIDYNGGDWYNDSCIIKYEPINATEGGLKIDCAIYSKKK